MIMGGIRWLRWREAVGYVLFCLIIMYIVDSHQNMLYHPLTSEQPTMIFKYACCLFGLAILSALLVTAKAAAAASGNKDKKHGVRGLASEPTKDKDKVVICHIPPGDPSNFHLITISKSAVKVHMDHGNLQGSCNDNCIALCAPCLEVDVNNCEEVCCPTCNPSESPSKSPSESPSESPSKSPSESPSESPSDIPSQHPSENPSENPSKSPSDVHSEYPSASQSHSSNPSCLSTTITFDDIPGQGNTVDWIPNGFKQFNWNNLAWIHKNIFRVQDMNLGQCQGVIPHLIVEDRLPSTLW
jgi:hypothetical protein